VTGVEAWFGMDSPANHRDIISLQDTVSNRFDISRYVNGMVGVWAGVSAVLVSDGTASINELLICTEI